jgi:hypothetical protein
MAPLAPSVVSHFPLAVVGVVGLLEGHLIQLVEAAIHNPKLPVLRPAQCQRPECAGGSGFGAC